MIFQENLQNKLQKTTRCDFVFDIYDRGASLKAQTQEGRGSGKARHAITKGLEIISSREFK